jgi:hypothetical protein
MNAAARNIVFVVIVMLKARLPVGSEPEAIWLTARGTPSWRRLLPFAPTQAEFGGLASLEAATYEEQFERGRARSTRRRPSTPGSLGNAK